MMRSLSGGPQALELRIQEVWKSSQRKRDRLLLARLRLDVLAIPAESCTVSSVNDCRYLLL